MGAHGWCQCASVRQALGSSCEDSGLERRFVWVKDYQGDGLVEGRGRFLVLLGGFAHVGCETWCSRGPRRDPVAAIIRWEATCIGTIGGPALTGVGLHALHARLVRVALGCREGYRPCSCGGPHVPGGDR